MNHAKGVYPINALHCMESVPRTVWNYNLVVYGIKPTYSPWLMPCTAMPCFHTPLLQGNSIPSPQGKHLSAWIKNSDPSRSLFFGATNRNRTDDLILTKDVLYQLSHSSICEIIITNSKLFVKQFFKITAFTFFMLI